MTAFSGIPDQPDPDDEVTIRLRERRLSVKERRLAHSLAQISPLLLDLYRQALLLSDFDTRPAFIGVAAHSARELSSGLLQNLTGYRQLTREERSELERQGEKIEAHADAIGRALHLHRGHPSVQLWFALHQALVDAAHYDGMAPNWKPAREAIRNLTPLLDALVGPYFDVQADLDAIVANETPTDTDFDTVLLALGNERLRWHCYRGFKGANWLRGLAARQCFGPPPMASRFSHNAWSPTGWPEGEYLLRIVDDAPDVVAAILTTIPKTNDNPTVWDIAAKCAMRLPVETNTPLHRLIAHGITRIPFVIWPRPLVELAARLAAAGRIDSALAIAKHLCVLRDPTNPDTSSAAPILEQPPSFRRISTHDVEEVVPRLTDAIAEANPALAQEWLVNSLRGAIKRTVQGSGFRPEEERATGAVKQLSQIAANAWRRVTSGHIEQVDRAYWCDRFDRDDHDADVRVILARAAAKASVTRARISEKEAEATLRQLARQSHPIFYRMRLYTLARCSPYADEAVDAWIRSETAVEFEFRNREAGDVLRQRFGEASPAAQARFALRVKRGPRIPLREQITRWFKSELAADSFEEYGRRWRFRILRRFDANLPGALTSLATELGYMPQVRPPEVEGVDEDGTYSGGSVRWAGERSPYPVAALADMTDSEIIDRLLNWSQGSPDSEAPSIEGLTRAVSELVTAAPARGVALGFAACSHHRSARAVAAIARGLRAVPEGERVALPTRLFEWLATTATVVEATPSDGTTASTEWRTEHEACRECLEALRSWVPAVRSVEELAGAWDALDQWLSHPVVWGSPHPISGSTTESLLMMAVNSTQGVIADAVVAVARRTYEVSLLARGGETTEGVTAAVQETASQVRSRLDALLARGQSSVATLAALGPHLPFLQFLDADWVASNREALLQRRMEGLPISVFWASYLIGGRLFETTFKRWRDEYRQTIGDLEAFPSEGQWSISQHVAEHLITLILWGTVSFTDDDQLLQFAWSKFRIEDIQHAYWAVFRGWSDIDGEIPPEMIRRLEEFWSWRVTQLPAMVQGTDPATEEANALSWFCVTPHVPLTILYRLGPPTLDRANAGNSATMSLWDILGAAPDSDADNMWPLVLSAVRAELRGPYPRLFASELGAIFEKLARTGSRATRIALRDLIHTLGSGGFEEFGRYRPPADPE